MKKMRQSVIICFVILSVVIISLVVLKPNAENNIQDNNYVEYTSKNQKSNNSINIDTNENIEPTKAQTSMVKNGLIEFNDILAYYEDDILQFDYTGLMANDEGTYLVENGIVTLDVNGLRKVDDTWYYFVDSKWIEDGYGLVKNKNGVYLVEEGKVNFSVTGLKKVKEDWFYFKKGKLQSDYTGIKSNEKGTWLVEDGEIDFGYKGTYVSSGSISNPKKGQKRYYVIKNKINVKRSKVITQALAYINTPYVYGGTSLRKGIDCSAYTRAIYGKAGISLARTSREQATKGKKVSLKNAKPGDLVFYSNGGRSSISHVAIYLGNNKIVHASSSRRKVIVSDVNLGMTIKCVKSYIN